MRRRRRPLGRRIRPVPAGPGRQARRMLARAHRALETGDHKRAADIFVRLARGAEDRGLMKHAPNLFLQAGRANLLAGNQEEALGFLKHGLTLFANAKRWPALNIAGKRVVDNLRENGMDESAQEISEWLKTTLADHPIERHAPRSQKQLPSKCEFCGATVRSDEIEWIDANSVECVYCGSSLKLAD